MLALLVCLQILAACQAPPVREPWDPASGRAPPERVRWPIGGRAQGHSLSCESRSACDLCGWYGVEVTEDVFLEGLARSTNPEEGFVGSVDDPGGGLPPRGYGVYEEPVADRIRALGLPAVAGRGRSPAWLRDRLALGHPVIVWAVSGLEARPPVTLLDARGRRFQAVAGEHTFLAIGYDGGRVLLLDPSTGWVKDVDWARFDASWGVLGRRTVHVEAERSSGR